MDRECAQEAVDVLGIELGAGRGTADLRVGGRVGPVVLELGLGLRAGVEVWRGRRADGASGEVLRVEVVRASPGQLAGLRTLAQQVRALGHARVLAPRGIGSLPDGRAYRVLPWVEGPDLADARRAGPLEPDDLRRVFRELADALACAHAVGLTHGSLGPDAVVIDEDGPVLTGLGLGPHARSTGGSRAGTLAYQPPEAFAREGGVDAVRADVYALGVLLYEALTGACAFEDAGDRRADHAAVGLVARKLETVALTCPRGTPTELAEVVRLCTEADPAARIGDLGEVRDRLDGLRGARPVVRAWRSAVPPRRAPPAPPPETPRPREANDVPFALHLLLPPPVEELPMDALDAVADDLPAPAPPAVRPGRVLVAVAVAALPAFVVLALTWPGVLGP